MFKNRNLKNNVWKKIFEKGNNKESWKRKFHKGNMKKGYLKKGLKRKFGKFARGQALDLQFRLFLGCKVCRR